MVSTASRVGTGNIVGIATAICLGGYGAVFWMWVIELTRRDLRNRITGEPDAEVPLPALGGN